MQLWRWCGLCRGRQCTWPIVDEECRDRIGRSLRGPIRPPCLGLDSHSESRDANMRVVVYEPTPTGHHFAYLALMLPALAELASEVILLTSETARASAQFSLHLEQMAGTIQVDTGIENPGPRSPRAEMRELTSLARAVRRLRPGFTYPTRSLRRRLVVGLTPTCIRMGPWNWIHHINPDDIAVLGRQSPRMAACCSLMPDPVEPPSTLSRSEARRTFNLPEDGRYIGCAGAIDRRKGIDVLVCAFRDAASRMAPNDRLLLAGPFDPSIKRFLDQELARELASERVLVLDRHLSVTEMNDVIAALDVVCTPYPHHVHSASIVIRAASHGRYVLGNAIGWMKNTIERFHLGECCDVLDAKAFANAIPASLEAASEFHVSESAQRFARFHSSENFRITWAARLRERLGLPVDPERITWDWVLEAVT
jgi:glycosyltransferase involved in cell wall biosynthesis